MKYGKHSVLNADGIQLYILCFMDIYCEMMKPTDFFALELR